MTMEPEVYEIGDTITLKKSHPCGAADWTVVRLGADIGLECLGCGHRVLLTRRELARRTKRHLRAAHAEKEADSWQS